MLYAIDKNGNKVKPEPKEKAKRPFCKGTVIACTGEIKNWYWRHEMIVKSDCLASTYENEGIWHSTWKYLFDSSIKFLTPKAFEDKHKELYFLAVGA